MAISGDGRFVVYSAIEENPGPQAKPQLYLRRMDQAEAEPITGTEGGINPFLSPDNRWVGFWADGKLKKISVEGGVATELCDARNIFGADWGADNRIVFADEGSGGLSLISSEGGKPEPLTKPDPKREESSHRLPSWLRNGKAVFFSVMKHSFDTHPSLSLFRLDTHEWQALLPDAANARYVSTGHLVFLRQGVLMAVRFDEARLEIIGQPIPLVPDVMQVFSSINPLNTGAGQFALSGAGSLIYAAGGIMSDPQNTLVWVDQKGNEQPVTDKKFPYFAPRLSPDGEKIAYATLGREYQIHVYDISKGTNILLTNEGWACFPVWTPDSKKLIFAWRLSLATNLFWRPYDGSSEMERLTTSEYNQYPESYPPGGTTVTLAETSNRGSHIDVLDTRTGRVTPFLNSPFNEQYPEFSPDRRWIAYVSNESGRNEVFVQDFPDKKIKIPVSSEGGTEPLWARNGKQIFFRCEDQVWAADVQTEGRLAIGKPRLLFEKTGYEGGSTIRAYDLSLDDQRFLMTRIEQRKPTPITEMILVQNWFEELKQKVPTGSK
jgi:serine/threonine-protein kinase